MYNRRRRPKLYVAIRFGKLRVVDPWKLYHPSDSAKFTDVTWSETYGDGQASGVVYYDTVTFGSITLQNQAVEVATEEASTFSTDPGFDGILGLSLGPNHISQPNVPTFLESVYDLLESPLFTAKLTRPNENVGFYTFGYIDAGTLGGRTPQYTPVYTTGYSSIYWSFPSTIAKIGGQSVPVPADNIAIADTGTTLIYVNDVLLNEIYTALRGTCSTTGLGDCSLHLSQKCRASIDHVVCWRVWRHIECRRPYLRVSRGRI